MDAEGDFGCVGSGYWLFDREGGLRKKTLLTRTTPGGTITTINGRYCANITVQTV